MSLLPPLGEVPVDLHIELLSDNFYQDHFAFNHFQDHFAFNHFSGVISKIKRSPAEARRKNNHIPGLSGTYRHNKVQFIGYKRMLKKRPMSVKNPKMGG